MIGKTESQSSDKFSKHLWGWRCDFSAIFPCWVLGSSFSIYPLPLCHCVMVVMEMQLNVCVRVCERVMRAKLPKPMQPSANQTRAGFRIKQQLPWQRRVGNETLLV